MNRMTEFLSVVKINIGLGVASSKYDDEYIVAWIIH